MRSRFRDQQSNYLSGQNLPIIGPQTSTSLGIQPNDFHTIDVPYYLSTNHADKVRNAKEIDIDYQSNYYQLGSMSNPKMVGRDGSNPAVANGLRNGTTQMHSKHDFSLY